MWGCVYVFLSEDNIGGHPQSVQMFGLKMADNYLHESLGTLTIRISIYVVPKM